MTPDKGIEQPNKSLKDNSIPDDVRKQIVDFGVWYSGMAKEKVVRAYNRYLAERYVPETEEDYKLAQYESKHELPPSPIETPSKALSDLKAEIKILEEREVLWGNKQAMLNDEIERLKERCIYLAGEIDDRNRLIEQLKINYKESITRD